MVVFVLCLFVAVDIGRLLLLLMLLLMLLLSCPSTNAEDVPSKDQVDFFTTCAVRSFESSLETERGRQDHLSVQI